MSHALLAPSAAPIWGGGGCTAYPMLSAQYPDEEGEAARLGIAAHELAAHWLEYGQPMPSGTATYNGIMTTQDMITKVQVYIDRINILRQQYPDGEEFIEHRVTTPIHEDCWGTFDYGMYVPSQRHVHIIDLKYGFLKREVDDQLFAYGNGFVNELVNKMGRPVETITLGVVQPRAWHKLGPIREDTMHVSGLAESYNRLKVKAVESFTNPITRVGKHCRYCPVMIHCPANKEAVDHIMDFSESPELFELSDSDLGLYLSLMKRSQKLLSDRLDVLEEEAVNRIENGKHITGFHKGYGRGTREWTSKEEAKTLQELTGIQLIEETITSPAQAEIKGVPKDIVKAYVTLKQGKLSLRDGDPSELAQKVFKL